MLYYFIQYLLISNIKFQAFLTGFYLSQESIFLGLIGQPLLNNRLPHSVQDVIFGSGFRHRCLHIFHFTIRIGLTGQFEPNDLSFHVVVRGTLSYGRASAIVAYLSGSYTYVKFLYRERSYRRAILLTILYRSYRPARAG